MFITFVLVLKFIVMPGFNQKGPDGNGPMTGRKMGKCTGYSGVSNNQNESNDKVSGVGRGIGRGVGAGRGAGRAQGQGRGCGRGRLS